MVKMERRKKRTEDLTLGGHFNDTRLVDDTSRLVALLHDANNPGLIALLLMDVLAIGGGLFAR